MADTKRSLADLLVLYADEQPDGAGTFQNHRDILESLAQPFGGAYMDGNATETTINTINVFETIAGTFIDNSNLKEITVGAGGLLTYTGVPNRHFHIVSNMSFTAAANNKVICFQWHKNGSTLLPAPIEDKIGTGTDIRSISVHADVMMSTNDTLQLKVANSTDVVNVTIKDIYTFVQGMFV